MTVVVTLTDRAYFNKAKRTILDIRSRGEWTGDVVLITVGFDPSRNFLDYYNIIHKRVDHIQTDYLLTQYRNYPIQNEDQRHVLKLTQWDKFYVFDDWFKQWDKVIFFDAGLRVLDKISILNDIPCKDVLLAPDDTLCTTKTFKLMWDLTCNPCVTETLLKEYPDMLEEPYFLNCIWVYDTSLLNICTMKDMIDTMNQYPITKCNEMTIMNLLFTIKHKVWKPFPEFIGKKRLFGWCEHDKNYGDTTWRNFCFIKYPYTINMECD
jgi:hypothetical protein